MEVSRGGGGNTLLVAAAGVSALMSTPLMSPDATGDVVKALGTLANIVSLAVSYIPPLLLASCCSATTPVVTPSVAALPPPTHCSLLGIWHNVERNIVFL